MLDGLGAVDWQCLTHAYGPAGDTPGYLRALLSPVPEERKGAREALCSTIGHQGSRYTATAAAIPFLFQLLEDPTAPERDQLIRLLTFLAMGYHEEHLPAGFDPAAAFAEAETVPRQDAGPERYDDYDEAVAALWARDAYEAVVAGIAQLHTLTQDRDPAVRKAAVFSLAWFPAAAGQSIPLVRQACRSAGTVEERTNAILCMGLLDRYLEDASDGPWLLEQLGADGPRAVRVAAAISLAVLPGNGLPGEALAVLLEAVGDTEWEEAEGRRVAWDWSGMIAQVSQVIRHISPEPTAPVVEALCGAVERVPPPGAGGVIAALLSVVFPDGEGVRFEPDSGLASGVRVVHRDPATLSEVQRRAVEAVGRSPFWEGRRGFDSYSELLWSYGLPYDREKFEEYLASTA